MNYPRHKETEERKKDSDNESNDGATGSKYDDPWIPNQEAARILEEDWKAAERAVCTKMEVMRHRLNELHDDTLEAIVNTYRSKGHGKNASWQSLRKAADHLSEMHSFLKSALPELHGLAQVEGSLSYSLNMLSRLCPGTSSDRSTALASLVTQERIQRAFMSEHSNDSVRQKRSHSPGVSHERTPDEEEQWSSTSDEDERLEKEIKRRRTDRAWR